MLMKFWGSVDTSIKHGLSMGERSACNTQGAKQMLQGHVKVDLFFV